MRRFSLMALALVGTALGAVGLAAQASAPPGRPLIVFVHGRGHLDRDSAAVRSEWERSLRLGAREISTGPLFDERDVRLVWYADVLDPTNDEGCRRVDGPPSTRTRADSSSSGARLLLAALAAALDEPKGRREVRGLLGDLLYLADPWKRCGVERRLATVLAEAERARRPVVLVTHSLGAAVAYRHLRDHDGAAVSRVRWVTLGAPLGDPDLRSLLLGEDRRALTVPARVTSWVNVVLEGDPFASALASVAGVSKVTDLVRPSTGHDPHDLAAYLKDEAAARAIVGAWCEAFEARGRPEGCRGMGR